MGIKYTSYTVGHCSQLERFAIKGGKYKTTQFPARCFLLKHPTHGLILFDTGFSSQFLKTCEQFPERLYNFILSVQIDEHQNIAAQLLKSGVNPSDVSTIIISHFHIDHIGGTRDFPNAQFICSMHAYNAIKKLTGYSAILHGFSDSLLPSNFSERVKYFEDYKQQTVLPEFPEAYDIYEDGSIWAVPLDGHAEGHFGIYFKDNTGSFVFLIGDACWSSEAYRSNKLPHFMTRLIHHDWNAYCSTLKKLHRLHTSNREILIIPSHCQDDDDGI